ncbi:MAG TPA: hypothetical protein PK052_08995 [Anaerohalosphaeraceae bacterium]|nr:hypothetical protein [Phycisphaerae bacterium]HOK95301.1 hypothetical protein [Anaerohalosphaeraceae bacterium]HOL32106.1 hypothetical protein [Anaerohalosphaeraceae bacterium]HOM76360.1 hypothetical protein [Anaerohalosphaeraceae bacterium]HPC64198.1 hypothetical protein [Anaerohalosphaeraceae bacterium]
MKTSYLLLSASLLGILAGCVPSLHQLWTDKTLIFDDTIAGTYKQDESTWVFVGNPQEKSYTLTISEKEGRQSKLIARLVEVSGKRFFDFYPATDAELEAGEWLKLHILPVHLFFKVEKTAESFKLAAMNPDEVGKLLKEKPQLIKHEVVEDDRVVLTDRAENLQKFLLEGLAVEKFFGDPMELCPVK